jgi:imidazolonepropionase-like amidohydrolase
VVLGSDAGNIGSLHGPVVFREADLMVQAGLTPLEVLRAATTNGATAMGMANDLGAVAPGRLADLAILDADPLVHVANLSRVDLIVKDGQVFEVSRLAGTDR